MSDKLKQIDEAIKRERQRNDQVIAVLTMRGLDTGCVDTVILEALELYREVEEGKKFVGEWHDLDCDRFYDNDEHEKLFTTDGIDLWVGSCDSIGASEGITKFVSFNNNNGEIPLPQEGE